MADSGRLVIATSVALGLCALVLSASNRSRPRSTTPAERSFRAFLRATRKQPGMGFRLGLVVTTSFVLYRELGLWALLLTVAVSVALSLLLGYRYFRTHGRLLGGAARTGRS